nr:hypothetical protein CFP56_24096 [Quercus suber]
MYDDQWISELRESSRASALDPETIAETVIFIGPSRRSGLPRACISHSPKDASLYSKSRLSLPHQQSSHGVTHLGDRNAIQRSVSDAFSDSLVQRFGILTRSILAQIRYFLSHPLTPRPLRFSRQRSLRHWTIHRAFLLHRSKLQKSRELELERQYNSMREACEALRLTDMYGLTTKEREQLDAPMEGGGKDVGRLYRIAMKKDGVWDGVPIEYARLQTETPPREGYNTEWTR